MRVAVCLPQVPFAHGGAEIVTGELVDEINRRGHEATLVSVPFKWYPGTRVLSQALLWRLLDLDEANGLRIDRVIATKFPSYAVRHREKVVWLIHQFRQAYELDRTALGQFGEEPIDRATRRAIHRLDVQALGEAHALFTTSRNNAERLSASTALTAEVLPHPPQALAYRCDGFGNYVLSVGRLDRAKRVDLLLEAARARPGVHVVIAGDGPDRARLEELSGALELNGRVRFAGSVSAAELTDLYARCLAVYYAPVDEDFGMVPYEAFLSGKPVVTTADSGGPLEIVAHRRNGLICEATADAIGEACSWLAEHRDAAAAWGGAGKVVAERVTWDRVVERLLAP